MNKGEEMKLYLKVLLFDLMSCKIFLAIKLKNLFSILAVFVLCLAVIGIYFDEKDDEND